MARTTKPSDPHGGTNKGAGAAESTGSNSTDAEHPNSAKEHAVQLAASVHAASAPAMTGTSTTATTATTTGSETSTTKAPPATTPMAKTTADPSEGKINPKPPAAHTEAQPPAPPPMETVAGVGESTNKNLNGASPLFSSSAPDTLTNPAQIPTAATDLTLEGTASPLDVDHLDTMAATVVANSKDSRAESALNRADISTASADSVRNETLLRIQEFIDRQEQTNSHSDVDGSVENESGERKQERTVAAKWVHVRSPPPPALPERRLKRGTNAQRFIFVAPSLPPS